MICESTQHTQVEVVVTGLQCLSKAISMYYPLMEDYLNPAIWPISVHAVSSSLEPIVLQGLELWNSICESELDMLEDGDPGSGWIQPVLKDIVPPLIQGTFRLNDEKP